MRVFRLAQKPFSTIVRSFQARRDAAYRVGFLDRHQLPDRRFTSFSFHSSYHGHHHGPFQERRSAIPQIQEFSGAQLCRTIDLDQAGTFDRLFSFCGVSDESSPCLMVSRLSVRWK